MIICIILVAVLILAFIAGGKNTDNNQSHTKSNQLEIEPIYDDGEIVGWYED